MRKHTGLAHGHDFSQRADTQSFKTDLSGESQRCFYDGSFGLLTFVQQSLSRHQFVSVFLNRCGM